MPYIQVPNGIDPYQQAELTDHINRIDAPYGFIRSLKLFNPRPISTTIAPIDVNRINTSLVEAIPRGQKATILEAGMHSNRSTVALETLHLPVLDKINRSDFQDERTGGSSNLQTENEIISERIFIAKKNLMTSIEYYMTGAMRGRIVNTDGTLIYDLFDKFNVTQTPVSFGLSSVSEMQTKCNEVTRKIDDALGADSATGYMCLASDTWFDAFIAQASAKAAWAGYALAGQRLGGDVRRSYSFAGINIVNYNPKVFNSQGMTLPKQKFIPEGQALFFPLGTSDTFLYFMAPAALKGIVNTKGKEFYAQRYDDPDGRSLNLDIESNVLPICTKPDALVTGTF